VRDIIPGKFLLLTAHRQDYLEIIGSSQRIQNESGRKLEIPLKKAVEDMMKD